MKAYKDLPIKQGNVVLGLYKESNEASTVDYKDVCLDVIPKITDMSWLREGDSVFVKVACNSGCEHPAVTDPKAVEALVWYLKQKGSGKVYVGDQAGVEHVRMTLKKWEGRTRQLMNKNGLLGAVGRSNGTLWCFEDYGWDGYYRPLLLPSIEQEEFDSWGYNLWVPKILHAVDHIVYLPRLGAHTIAGYTCGIKNAVGFLRDDSRKYLHQQGDKFFELLAEINHAPVIRNKLRFCLTLGSKAMVTLGPDFGEEFEFPGVFALGAENLIDHDYIASLLIPWLNKKKTTFYDLYDPYPEGADWWNRFILKRIWKEKALGSLKAPSRNIPLAEDPCLSHLAQLQGFRREQNVLYKEAACSYFDGLF